MGDAGKTLKGFAALSPARRREIASLGGKATQARGTGHRFTPETGRDAGRRGGLARQGTQLEAPQADPEPLEVPEQPPEEPEEPNGT